MTALGINNTTAKANAKTGTKVSAVSIATNFSLAILKFLAGILGNSVALISDAIHSASDMLGSFIIMIGIRMSAKDADDNYQYGYERMESIAAMILSFILFSAVIGIGASSLKQLFSGSYKNADKPASIALIVAVISIASKEALFWYMKISGEKIKSSALKADAWHQRFDALSSVGSFIGIFGARMGFSILEPIASLFICIFVLQAAFDIFKEAVAKISDKSLDETRHKEITDFILNHEEVMGVHSLRSRKFGNKAYVEFSILADKKLTFQEVYDLRQSIAYQVEQHFTEIKQCMVSTCPTEAN